MRAIYSRSCQVKEGVNSLGVIAEGVSPTAKYSSVSWHFSDNTTHGKVGVVGTNVGVA